MELKLQDNTQYKHPLTTPDICINTKPYVKGKFIYVGDEKFYIRGVTYGTFSPHKYESEYHNREVVRKDFELMIQNGINAVRTYTVPPLWFLDLAYDF